MSGTAAGAAKARARQADLQARRKRVGAERLALAREVNGGARGYPGGLKVSLGHIDEEYVPELRQVAGRVRILKQMGNDAKIKAQLRSNSMPLLSAVRWGVEGGTEEMRRLVESNLLRRGDRRLWCDTSWTQNIMDMCRAQQYGFALFGKTWEVADEGRVYLKRLTYLQPHTLAGPAGPWEWDAGGVDLVAVHRTYTLPSGQQVTDERIPVVDLFAVVWDMEGSNWEGNAMIRSMYRPWKQKDLLWKILMVHFQNVGVGIPMASMGPQDGVKDRDSLKEIAASLRGGSKERQFIVKTAEQKMEFLTAEGGDLGTGAAIQQNDMDIASAGATDFIQQGQTQSGSRASGSVLMVDHMQQLDAARVILEDQINHGAGTLPGLVEELIDMNFDQVEEYPRLVGSRVSPTEQLDNVPNIVDAVQKGGLLHDLKVENHNRKALGLEAMTQAEFEKAKQAAMPRVEIGGRPEEVGDSDREEPRDDTDGRRFGLQAEKKTPDATRPKRNAASYPWLASTRN